MTCLNLFLVMLDVFRDSVNRECGVTRLAVVLSTGYKEEEGWWCVKYLKGSAVKFTYMECDNDYVSPSCLVL